MSFLALRDLMLAIGYTSATAWAFPAIIDTAVAVATVMLVALGDKTRSAHAHRDHARQRTNYGGEAGGAECKTTGHASPLCADSLQRQCKPSGNGPCIGTTGPGADTALSASRSGSGRCRPCIRPDCVRGDDAIYDRLQEACLAGNASFYTSGGDPGWAGFGLALAPLTVAQQVRSLRVFEIYNYGQWNNPQLGLYGFGALDTSRSMILMPELGCPARGVGDRDRGDAAAVAAGVGVAGGGPRSGLFQLGVNGSIDLERLLERTSNDDGRGMVVLWWRVSHDNDLSLR